MHNTQQHITQQRIILLSVIFLVFPWAAHALGLSAEPNRDLTFEPNLQASYDFCIRGTSRDVEIFADGSFLEYVTISKDIIRAGDKDKCFTTNLDFPESAGPPGHYLIWIGAREIIPESVGIAARVDTRMFIKLNILFDGPYLEVDFEQPTVDLGYANFNIIMNNFGTQEVTDAQARIDVYDIDGAAMGTAATNDVSIPSNEKASLKAKLNITSYEVGDYRAVATITGDGRTQEAQRIFSVGALQIAIVDFTKKAFVDEINKLAVEIQSQWDEPINDIHATINVSNKGSDVQTSSALTNIQPFEKKNITVFFDTTDFLPGIYPAEASVHFLEKKTVQLGEITIQERPARLSPSGIFVATSIVIIVILIIINILILRRRKDETK